MKTKWEMTQLGRLLKAKIEKEATGYQENLAAQTGLSKAALSDLKNGNRPAKQDSFMRLFRGFEGDRKFQRALIEAQIRDYLPEDLYQFVEVVLRVPGVKTRKLSGPSPDELDDAIAAVPRELRAKVAELVNLAVRLKG